jgi:hypothetical protein
LTHDESFYLKVQENLSIKVIINRIKRDSQEIERTDSTVLSIYYIQLYNLQGSAHRLIPMSAISKDTPLSMHHRAQAPFNGLKKNFSQQIFFQYWISFKITYFLTISQNVLTHTWVTWIERELTEHYHPQPGLNLFQNAYF